MQNRPDRATLLARYEFELDPFQLDALDAVDAGQNVIVAAPTGSGKTVVAEYGVAAALQAGHRAFYTAPIKALSNQKFHDLTDIHGPEHVGLLTGDNSVNGDAPVVVMTTEVLRNMIYAGRPLDDLAVVVLDEVHFLQDTYRGPVWEEVIVHLPAHVRLICLSATVSNSGELAAWMETVRGPTVAVVEERRPVRLDQWYFVSDRTDRRRRLLPTLVDGRANPSAVRLDAGGERAGRSNGGRTRAGRRPEGGRRRLATPSRVEVIDELRTRDFLPAIYFIFSRAQCDEAAHRLVGSGIGLLDESRRRKVRSIVDRRLGGLDDDDLVTLGLERFVDQLDHGVAAHHAGMVPAFKEVVEEAFRDGLLEVVFATETLALGVNMPARTVVIEKLTKFTGDHHELLTAGQFTQLTGRAGRRGIDEIGNAVVLWSPFVRFDSVADLALSRSFRLRSAFRPTYNMVANLVRTHSSDGARRLLTVSFAQFQADRDVVKWERRLQHRRARRDSLRAEARSPFGDIDDFRRSVSATSDDSERDGVAAALDSLKPGDVIDVSAGRHHGPAAVVATAHRSRGITVTVVLPNGRSASLTASDFARPPRPIGTVVLPGTYSPNRHDYRAEVGRRIRRASLDRHADRVESRVEQRRRHPVEDDPDLGSRLATARRADRVDREIAELSERMAGRRSSLADEYDAVVEILSTLGQVDVEQWSLTAGGELLAGIFHESDLLIAESLQSGLLDGLDPPTLAGLVSVFVYEHRSPLEPPAPWFPSAEATRRWESVERLSRELNRLETANSLAVHRPPDPGFVAIAHGWVSGEGFATVVADEHLTGGDFVRTMKQVVDLLGQLERVAPDPGTRATAKKAARDAYRGVVADSSMGAR